MGIPKIAARAGMSTYVALLLWSDDGHKANRAPAKTRLRRWRRHIPTCRECVYGRAAIYRAPPSLPLVCRSRRRSKMPLPSLRAARGKDVDRGDCDGRPSFYCRATVTTTTARSRIGVHHVCKVMAAGDLKLFPDFAMKQRTA